ncbi:MAG TPA: class I SAM-dependent methyltransferase [Gammaproteobacteria bacterium]|nr:class I SAM-dependent methyltransferase [Gammaproteobacteria bacterium]
MSRRIRRTPLRHKSTLASRADRHALYQQSVQDARWEISFLERLFHEQRGRAAMSLREDFCGTALAACEWVRRNPHHTAVGVDLDAEVLAWGREHNLAKLTPAARSRITLLQQDVLKAQTSPVDMLLAFNFSYWIFKDRAVLRKYFRRARAALKQDGLFLLDAYGGSDAYLEMRERDKIGRFTYIWDQADYDPVTSHTTCHIHFAFPDGSRLERAFTYHWRLWTLPELRELLLEAGFSAVKVYLEDTDPDTGEGTGEFSLVERGEADPAWIAYLVAQP